MFVTEVKDADDLFVFIVEFILYCMICLEFMLSYMYLIKFNFGSSGIENELLRVIFTNELVILAIPTALVYISFGKMFKSEKAGKIKFEIEQIQITALLAIDIFMGIYMFYTKGWFILPAIVNGAFILVPMISQNKKSAEALETESEEVILYRKKRACAFIFMVVFFLMAQMHK